MTCNMITSRMDSRVLLNVDLSNWGTVTTGVPQESILGPLLFAVHLNDLPIVVKYSILDLYADDAELHALGSGSTCTV